MSSHMTGRAAKQAKSHPSDSGNESDDQNDTERQSLYANEDISSAQTFVSLMDNENSGQNAQSSAGGTSGLSGESQPIDNPFITAAKSRFASLAPPVKSWFGPQPNPKPKKVPGHIKLAKKKADLNSVIKKSAHLTAKDLQRFRTLCQCIDRTARELGWFRYNQQIFWPYVANCIADTGLKHCDQRYYRKLFLEHVANRYKIVLRETGQYSKAVEVYPLFQVIHHMDLRQSLSHRSCQKINKHKRTFKIKLIKLV